MDELLKLSPNTIFHVTESLMFTKLKEKLEENYTGIVEWFELCYLSDFSNNSIVFTSNDEDVAEYIQSTYGSDSAVKTVREIFNIDEQYNIKVNEVFLEEYDDLYFAIHIYERGEE